MNINSRNDRPTFHYFIGIDQTGAAARKGLSARPLPAAFVSNSFGTSGLELAFIDSLSPTALCRAFGLSDVQWRKTAILVDCVFGLPMPAWPYDKRETGSSAIWTLIQEAGAHSFSGAEFGRNVAENFFESLLKRTIKTRKSTDIPIRRCEEIANANSVFRTRPYQKNIQTGTYRIWKDMGRCSPDPWSNIWPFDDPRNARTDMPWVFEAFPSLFWRNLLGLPSRDRNKLREAVKDRIHPPVQIGTPEWNRITESPDMADAAVLALGGHLLSSRGQLLRTPGIPADELMREGWIVGL